MTDFFEQDFTTETERDQFVKARAVTEEPLSHWARQSHYERQYGVAYGTMYVKGLHVTIATHS